VATKKHEPLSASIRRLIDSCGLTRYELSKRSGVTEASLSRFMSKQTGLNTESLDKLASACGWKIVGGKKLTPKSER
jgi:transcriptional regulator with XRE-family HTH domain